MTRRITDKETGRVYRVLLDQGRVAPDDSSKCTIINPSRIAPPGTPAADEHGRLWEIVGGCRSADGEWTLSAERKNGDFF